VRKAWVVALVMLCVAAGPALPDEKLVRRDFMKLKAALEQGNGVEAAALVSPGTLRQYEQARTLALGGEGTDLESLPQVQVMLILQLRYQADRQALEKMADGAGAFAWGVERGLLKKQTVNAFTLRQVSVEGDQATATLSQTGKPVNDLDFHFEKTPQGRWTLRLEKVVEAAEPQLAKLREKAGKTKTEFALYLMERTYGQPMPPEILKGPIK
jgi:hypothetical protein